MPFTPFHFGAGALASLPFRKRIDVTVFILANVVIDIEPLLVMVFQLNYPLHGYAHTFLGSTVIGSIFGAAAWRFSFIFKKIARIIKLPESFSLSQYIISAILGGWLHVLFDSPLYGDILPFFPLDWNPFLGLVDGRSMYLGTAALFIPAIGYYLFARTKN